MFHPLLAEVITCFIFTPKMRKTLKRSASLSEAAATRTRRRILEELVSSSNFTFLPKNVGGAKIIAQLRLPMTVWSAITPCTTLMVKTYSLVPQKTQLTRTHFECVFSLFVFKPRFIVHPMCCLARKYILVCMLYIWPATTTTTTHTSHTHTHERGEPLLVDRTHKPTHPHIYIHPHTQWWGIRLDILLCCVLCAFYVYICVFK